MGVRISEDVATDMALLVVGLIDVLEGDLSIHQINLGPDHCKALREIGKKISAEQTTK